MCGKLFFIVVFALALSVVLASPSRKSNYIEQENSCREVCGLCDCDGFYCEDECICECSLENEQNLQCIADMKTECDANGLEYELMMEESAKQRFLREVRDNGLNMDKHLFVMKQKRASNSSDPVVGAAAAPASDPAVAAPAPNQAQDSTLGNAKLAVQGASSIGSLSSVSSIKAGLNALPSFAPLPALPAAAARNVDFSKVSIVLRDHLKASKARIAAASSALTPVVTPAAVVDPTAAITAARAALKAKLSAFKVPAPAAAASKSSFAGIGSLGTLPSLASLTSLKGKVL